MKSSVIYTCLTGGYDELPQYDVLDPDFDYICFSNDYAEGSKVGMWTIRKIPYESTDNTRLSRYVKINPHIALPEYKYSIWLDSNLLITSNAPYTRIKELISQGVLMASVVHPDEDCIYSDAVRCVKEAKIKISEARKQISFLKEMNYPQHNGLYENNLIIRCHNEPIIKKISEDWWDLYCKYTKRDQLSLCYVLWNIKFKPENIYPSGITTHNAEGIKRLGHNKLSFTERIKFFIIKRLNKIIIKINPLYKTHEP